MHKNQTIGSTFSTSLLVATLMLGACGRPPAGVNADKSTDSDVPVPIEAATAARKAIVASYSGTAALEPENQAMVVAKTSGVLLKLMVEEGDAVRAGDLLAQLDPEKPRLELARAEANLKRLENDYRRSSDLFTRKLVSAEAQEKARFDLETQKAAYDIARLELDYTRIVAPIGGVISVRMVKEGNLIQINQSLFRIDDFDPLLAVLNVPERELAILRPELPVAMAVDALAGKSFVGAIARVSPVVDAQTGTFRVTAEFRDPSGQLKSGMFGRLNVVYDERKDALVVPREAVIDEDGRTSVFVVSREKPKPPADADKAAAKAKAKEKEEEKGADGKAKPAAPAEITVARLRDVKVGYTTGDRVEVREGLAEGDQVITVGRAAVRDGTSVTVLEAAQ